MAFFRLPRVPEMVFNFAGLRSAGLGLRATGLPAESWHRDRDQLRRVGGLHGPLNWYRGAINRNTKLRRVSVPTLYIWGRRDFALGRRAAELTGKYVTGPYRFEEIKAGHWIIDRNPGELQRLLGEHLEDFSEPKPAPDRQTRVEVTGRPAPAKTAASRAPAKAAAKRAPAKRAKPAAKRTPKPPEAHS
jgi:hypothetical protein